VWACAEFLIFLPQTPDEVMVNLGDPPEGSEGVATNWFVVTGAPCSGKTTVIHELERRGYSVVHEAARAYIEANLAAGLSLARIRGDVLAFERRLLEEKAAIERKLGARDTLFLDRAVPDSIAYFRLSGFDPSEPIALSGERRYKKIFLLDRLPARKDAVRKEDDGTASSIETLLIHCYRDLGYPLIRIPVSSVAGRADLILEHLE
jgi:predicted ATPase